MIYASYTTIDGLLYASSMHANQPSVALYERGASALPAVPLFDRSLSDPVLLSRLNNAATQLNYGLV